MLTPYVAKPIQSESKIFTVRAPLLGEMHTLEP